MRISPIEKSTNLQGRLLFIGFKKLSIDLPKEENFERERERERVRERERSTNNKLNLD